MNLLPALEKKRNQREYWLRLSVTSFVVLGVVFVFGALMILPSYFLVEGKRSSLLRGADTFNGGDDVLSTAQQIEEMTRQMAHAEELPISGDIARHMEQIIEVRPGGVTLSSLFFQKQAGERRFTISGVAQTRESLASYTTALQEIDAFSKVAVPISNFAQNRNISFSMSITLAPYE